LPNSGGYRSGTLYYYFHIVKKDETLSHIAQIYELSVNEILEVNTTISDPGMITEGLKIKVPNYSSFIKEYPRDQWNFILYRVKQGEKLKSIAKAFGTDADDIRNVNRGIENKPATGSEIRVPVRKQNVAIATQKPDIERNQEHEKGSDDKREQNRQPARNPALTFNWGNDTPKTERTVINNTACAEYTYKKGTIFKISLIASMKKNDGTIDPSGTSFLCGAMIAVNEMKNNGMSVKLNTFNTGNSSGVNRILNSPELRESNIIIAQTSLGDLVKLAAYAAENKIYLVIPYESKARSLTENNPFVIQLHPSDNTVFQKLISKQYNDDVFPILIKPEKPDSLMLANYRAALKKRFGTFKEQSHKIGLQDLEYKGILDVNRLNLIFVCPVAEPSKNQSFVSDLISRLNLVKHRLSVYGSEEWYDYMLLDRFLYFNVNMHIAKSIFVDYNNDATKLFVQLYRKAFNSEPGKYAFLGYDVTYYFLAVLRKYGNEFQDCVSGFDSVLLQSHYKLVKNSINGGFINEGCFMVEYTGGIETKRE
jgi:LysM repeat protein